MAQHKTRKSRSKTTYVGQFLIVLPGTDPLVWRRILVPEAYTFWDLHVAIQDAMGWMDAHLHEFEIVDPSGRLERIGIPLDDLDDVRPTVAAPARAPARPKTWAAREATPTSCRSSGTPTTRSRKTR